MKIKAFLCLLLAFLMLAGCTPVKIKEDLTEKESTVSTPPVAESESTVSESTSIVPESNVSDIEEEVYTPPAILSESYEQRVAYFGEYWEMGNDPNNNETCNGYFNDSVFVGNSIMLHFKNFVQTQRQTDSGFLGNAKFFAGASFSFYNNANQTPESKNCALPLWEGQAMNITDAVGKINPATVYLSLMALNDIAIYRDGMTGIDETYKLVVALLEELKTLYPGTRVVLLSNTYLHGSDNSSKNKLHNGNISDLNTKVLNYCNQNGYDFIDVSSVLLDNVDALGDEFCSDVGSASFACHLTSYAYNAWTYILRDYAAAKRAGTWKNPDYMKGLVPPA